MWGWILNLLALIHAPAIPETGGLILARVVGIFIPFIGAVLGWFA